MILRRFVAPVLAATVLVAACKKAPPPPPAPTGPSEAELARRRADSIAAARAAAEEAARQRAEAEAAAARERARGAARTTLEQMVFFDYDKSEIRDDAAAVLRSKVGILRASPQVQIQIQGHADERGSTEYNLALGNRRAEAVRQFLVGFGIPESRFSIISYGEERPLEMGSNEAAWSRNRRAQFVITAGANAINPAM
ncbi:MAG TPA: peptidoglycan-associated lipoprotein Pal [Longimicrobiales bacterium]|nr:peptidoglycan-associated lipoprotein Pal [Longimicrobiales bacterium]